MCDYVHVGHATQMDKRDVNSCHLHCGDEILDYEGVPSDWNVIFPACASLQWHKAISYK